MAVKKEVFSGYLRFRLDDEIKNEFANACISTGETPSNVLRAFIRTYVTECRVNKSGKKPVVKPSDAETTETEKPRYVAPIQDY